MPDPVPAIAERDATGATAEVFADIRATLGIPVVNLIWRHLATMDGGLEWAWKTARPIYTSGAAGAAEARMRAALVPPMPEPLIGGALHLVGLDDEARRTARAVVAAYDRGNALNLMALTALVSQPLGGAPEPVSGAQAKGAAAPLPPVLSEGDVSADTWRMVLALNTFGARPDEPILATLYRHLAHWPGLLALIHGGFAPLEVSGEIRRSISQARDLARAEGGRLIQLADTTGPRHEQAAASISEFADHVICRMVPIGIGLGRWMDGEAAARS
jgi:hypothetical protein